MTELIEFVTQFVEKFLVSIISLFEINGEVLDKKTEMRRLITYNLLNHLTNPKT